MINLDKKNVSEKVVSEKETRKKIFTFKMGIYIYSIFRDVYY